MRMYSDESIVYIPTKSFCLLFFDKLFEFQTGNVNTIVHFHGYIYYNLKIIPSFPWIYLYIYI